MMVPGHNFYFYSYVKNIMPRPKLNKTKLTLYIDKNVVESIKGLIPNISEFVEKKFREFLVLEKAGLVGVRGVGFEPTNPYGTGPSIRRLFLTRQPPLRCLIDIKI